ncbi:thioredoxin domain-containing protein [Streptomyces sp. NPDC048295]|uniref:thioredoxin family protein n=1 Tax=Streptomyces sp. NPDC048295 TaxID=3154617 RepID=UPI00342B1434
MAGIVIDVTDADFEVKVVGANGPVLAAFRAEWSDVCRALDPVLADVAKEYADRIVICRLDIDEGPETPRKYSITAIPTLHVFKGGKIVDTWIGPANKTRVVNLIAPYV